MTIRFPEKSIADKILNMLGKKRVVILPQNAYETFGRYVYAKARKESFFRSLLRAKNQKLPAGYAYLDDFYEIKESADN